MPSLSELKPFLLYWLSCFQKKLTAKQLVLSLSVEKIYYDELLPEQQAAVTKFRKLSQKDRLRMAKRVLKEL